MPTGTSVSVTLLLHFVSYYDNVTEVQLTIDPNNTSTGEVSFPYGADKTYVINSILSYEPSGNVTIKAGETLPIKMTLTPPKDGPSLPQFPLSPLGITLADVNGPRIAIIDEVRVMVNG